MFSMESMSRAAVLLAFSMAMTPTVFTIGPYIESRFFPVTEDTQILNEQTVPTGTSFYVVFNKARRCDFAGIAWYVGDQRLPVDFEPSAELMPRSRPPGDQHAGPWFVNGLHGTANSRAYVYHRCHPLWTTITRFYTG